ncbi:MAG: hypothetical protein JSR39_00390 [Verrucomicrobia bacterium]|nr:hypothetical protein [Verrucomicrobiota bacterium]
MAAAYPQPSKNPKASAVWAKAQKIKGEIDNIITKMQKQPEFVPTRDQLENYAEQLLEFISKNHDIITPHDRYLKAAVIDLTEIPEMAPQMQRISFLTCLRDASKNMNEFMGCQ